MSESPSLVLHDTLLGTFTLVVGMLATISGHPVFALAGVILLIGGWALILLTLVEL